MNKHVVVALILGAGIAIPLSAGPASAQPYSDFYPPSHQIPRPIDPYIVHELQIRSSDDYGTYLTDADGRALYVSTADRQGRGPVPALSHCYGQCVKPWPPAYPAGPIFAGSYVDRSLIGVIRREDGFPQVTYNGWPLYYYAGDIGVGQTEGQDQEQFGGDWSLISPRGRMRRD